LIVSKFKVNFGANLELKQTVVSETFIFPGFPTPKYLK